MADLKEVTVDGRESEGEKPSTSTRESKERTRSGKRRNSTELDESGQFPTSGQDPGGKPEGNRNEDRHGQPMDSQKRDLQSNQNDLRTQFYEHYRKEADDYDREFMKKYDEDLNTTLIFAGLFSAVTSAFIIDVQPQLQQDPNEEAAALLRVIIHKLDNTAFGDSVPTLPQWSGPPHTTVQVQAILYASLAASLLSAFLAMLGKQWLNRYASVDMRGTAIERSQNRQRKLDGIDTWYFDQVMEALPLMLQFALLLLGCALSRHIWEIDTTVASVVIGVTSFGVICYAFIVVAGTASVSCPYQTPGAQILRYLWQKVSNRYTFIATKSSTVQRPDIHLGPEHMLDREATALDFRCVSWMLRASLDRGINHLALKFLGSIIALPGSKTTIAVDCLNILISCVSATGDNQVVALRGSEQLVEPAATCLLGALSHSLITDPVPNILEDMRQRYRRVFSPAVDLRGLPSYPTISAIHNLFNRRDHPKGLDWANIEASAPENISLTHNLVKIAWSRYRGLERSKKVPRWVLRFSLQYLLRGPELPASVIADCLLIVAIDLGYDVSEDDVRNLDKSARLGDIVDAITRRLELIGGAHLAIEFGRKPIAVFTLWATQLEISHQPQPFSGRSHAIRRLELWDRIRLVDPGPAVVYLDVLLSCINVSRGRVTERPGSEQVARTASTCLLHALSGMDLASVVARRIRQRYLAVIPPTANFEHLLCYHTANAIHALLVDSSKRRSFEWKGYKPSAQEHVLFAAALVRVAYTKPPRGKVPRWVLRFAIDSLSQDPPPPTSVILDCLLIVAIDLGCDVRSTRATAPDESARLGIVLGFITQKLEAMVEAAVPDTVRSKRKAISTLFPYAVLQEREGRHETLDVFLRVARVQVQHEFAWRRLEPLVTALLVEESPVSPKRAALLASPHMPWQQFANGEHLVQLWAAAASAVPYTDDIGQSVVDTLLQIAHSGPLSPHIPLGMWSWLNKRPSLYPVCWGRYWGTNRNVLRMIRTLGDIEILKSYLLSVWSEWDGLWTEGFDETCTLIRKVFCGTEMGDHRQHLLQRLDYVLGRLDLGLEHLRQHKPSIDDGDIQRMKTQYGNLEKILLEVDERVRTSAQRLSTFTNPIPFPHPQLHDRNASQPFPQTPSRPARRPRIAASPSPYIVDDQG